jgi:hypothetical protein
MAAGKALLPCFSSQARAWDDAPLCMARPPDRAEQEEETLLGLDSELSCLPGEVREAAGPLWTAPITAAEARSALLEADMLAQQGRLANAMPAARGRARHAARRGPHRCAAHSRCCAWAARTGLRPSGLPKTARAQRRGAGARLGVVRGMLGGQARGEVELDKAQAPPNLETAALRQPWRAPRGPGTKSGAATVTDHRPE